MINCLKKHLCAAVRAFIEDAQTIQPPVTNDKIIETLETRFSERDMIDMGIGDFIEPYYEAKRERAMAQIEPMIRKEIETRYPWLKPQKDGTFVHEMFAERDDFLEPDSIQNFCSKDDPHQAFDEYLERIYADVRMNEQEDIVQSVVTSLEDSHLCENIEDMIRDLLQEIFFWNPPAGHFLEQEVCVSIQVDTGTGHRDFYEILNDGTLAPQAGLLWLSKQQGYSEAELRTVLSAWGDNTTESRFLRSVKREIEKATYNNNVLTFLVRMTVGQLLDLASAVKLQNRNGKFYDATLIPDCGTITLDAKTQCGLYNPWNGSGGPIDVELEKDVVIPIAYIHDLVLEYNSHRVGGPYLMMESFGMSGSAWQDTMKEFAPVTMEV